MGNPADIAKTMTPQQRECSDLMDSFPCLACGARGPSGCPLPPSTKIPARDLINAMPGLGSHLRAAIGRERAARAAVVETGGDYTGFRHD